MRIFRIAAVLVLAAMLGACTSARPTPNVVLVTPSAQPQATTFSSPLATPPLSPLATPFSSPLATPGPAASPSATRAATGGTATGGTAPSGTAPSGTMPAITPGIGTATISGYLYEGTKPAVGMIVGLGEIVPDASGKGALAGYSPTTSPRFITDATGRFVFANVKPGSYALILDRVLESFMLNDPKAGGDMVFTVKAGQVLDVGKLAYDQLPGSSQAAP